MAPSPNMPAWAGKRWANLLAMCFMSFCEFILRPPTHEYHECEIHPACAQSTVSSQATGAL